MNLTKRDILAGAVSVAAGGVLLGGLIRADEPRTASLVHNRGHVEGAPLSLARLDEAIDRHPASAALLMNKKTRHQMSAASKACRPAVGFLSWTKDEFGDRQACYGKLPILTVDEDGQGRPVLGFNEEPFLRGEPRFTSIYVLGETHRSILTDALAYTRRPGAGMVWEPGDEPSPASLRRDALDHVAALVRGLPHRPGVVRLRGVADAPITA